jgi:hypothetical protein
LSFVALSVHAEVLEREPEQNIKHQSLPSQRPLADIGFICGIGRSVVALPPFLTRGAIPKGVFEGFVERLFLMPALALT